MMSSFGLWLRDLQGSQGYFTPDGTARCHVKKTVMDCLLMDSGQGQAPEKAVVFGTAGGAGRTGPGSQILLQTGADMFATGCRASQSIH